MKHGDGDGKEVHGVAAAAAAAAFGDKFKNKKSKASMSKFIHLLVTKVITVLFRTAAKGGLRSAERLRML